MSDINIVFTRVDNRLVHGQVGNVLVTASGANLILVVDDETCNDELSKSLRLKCLVIALYNITAPLEKPLISVKLYQTGIHRADICICFAYRATAWTGAMRL